MRSFGFWLSLAAMAAAVVTVFSGHVFGKVTFVGDFDRLNSYLNIRLFEYDWICAYGRVPLWNNGIFTGYSMAGLHWMNPIGDPVPWLLALFDRSDVFRVLGYLSVGSVGLATILAWLYITDLTRPGLPALAGAILYGLSVFSLHRASQVDNAHMTLVLLPLGLLALRRAERPAWHRACLLLVFVLGLLAYHGFLQEAGYVFIYLGAYALYCTIRAYRRNRRDYLVPLIIFSLCALSALMFAAPRLISVATDIEQLSRTQTFFNTRPVEIARLLHEGMFGRTLAEGNAIGNYVNLHEGLQLIGSSLAVLVVIFGIARPRSLAELGGGVLFAAVVSIALADLLGPDSFYDRLLPGMSPAGAVFAINLVLFSIVAAAVARMRAWRSRGTPSTANNISDSGRSSDADFHVWVLGLVLAAALISEMSQVLHWLYGGLDFTHSRVSFLATMSLAALFAVYLERFVGRVGPPSGHAVNVLIAVVGIVSGLAAGWLIQSGFLDRADGSGGSILKVSLIHFNNIVLLRVSVIFAVLAAGTGIMIWARRRGNLPLIAALLAAACGFAVGEAVAYGRFKVFGDHTRTFPVPFRDHNFLTVRPDRLRPPSNLQTNAVSARLETGDYRSILVSDPDRFPGVTAPHLSQFWRLRLVGGYGAGVPARLAALPWPDGVVGKRSLHFRNSQDLPAGVLALINVKYRVPVDQKLHFNTGTGTTGWPRPVQNPGIPVPRHYLAASVTRTTARPTVAAGPAGQMLLFNGQPVDIVAAPVVEGIGSVPEAGFDTSGKLSVRYRGDRISVKLDRSNRERFLVINELFHPGWRAYAGGRRLEVYPVNAVMRGVRVPTGAGAVRLRFEPFSASAAAVLIQVLALALFAGGLLFLQRSPVSRGD